MKNYAFINANVITENASDDVLENATVVVKDGKIAAVGKSVPVPEGTKTIDLKGKYLMPGLINLHVHLPGSGMPKDTKKQNKKTVRKLMSNPLTKYIVYKLCASYAKVDLMSGVTTIRTVGGLDDIDSKIRDASEKGKLAAPRVIASNMAVSVEGGHMAGLLAYEAKDPEDGRNYVRKIAQTKPDLIKLMITGGVLDAEKEGEPGVLRMSPEIVAACCDEAHKLGFKVAAHVESPLGVKVALKGGVDTIEHGSRLDDALIESFKHNPNTLRGYSALIPTISAGFPLHAFGRDVTGITEIQAENSKTVVEGMSAGARAAHDAGVLVGVGTDTAMTFVTQYGTWRELALLVEYAGFTPAEALRAATRTNAKILNVSGITGSLDEGKYADMVVLDSNPLDDLSALAHPELVVAAGHPVWHPAPKRFDDIDRLLDEAMRRKA